MSNAALGATPPPGRISSTADPNGVRDKFWRGAPGLFTDEEIEIMAKALDAWLRDKR